MRVFDFPLKKMEIELSPKVAKKVYEGEGGSYLTWFPSELPMLKHGNIGAAKLFLNKFGFALPHYADSSKIGFVLQGSFFYFHFSSIFFIYFYFFKIYLLLFCILILMFIGNT